jgi:hypothetical protein
MTGSPERLPGDPKLNLVDRNDLIAEIIAKKIIELGQHGVRQAEQLVELAMKELGIE